LSLEHAILGFLKYHPLSGYDLKSIFDQSVKHFWSADQSQIYRTLSKLGEQGWATMEVLEQDDRPDRKIYRITNEGGEELHRWLNEQLPEKPERLAKLIQIFFAGHLSDEEAITLFERLADDCRKSLSNLQLVYQKGTQGESCKEVPPRDSFFWMLTCEYGIEMTMSSLKWLEDVLSRIKNQEWNGGNKR